MIKKIGKILLGYNRIISYFESQPTRSHTTYVNPLHIATQKIKFAEKGYTDQQIMNWENYPGESVDIEYLRGNDLMKKYITNKLDPAILDEQQVDQNIIGWNIQKQFPGHFTVPHYDLYHSMKNYTREEIARFWIPLEDAKFGHALFVENEILTDFKAGEIYDWDTEDLHAAINAGFDPRYTLLLYLKKKSV